MRAFRGVFLASLVLGAVPAAAGGPYVDLEAADRQDPRAIRMVAASFLAGVDDAGVVKAMPTELRGRPVAEGGWVIVQFDAVTTPAERNEILDRHAVFVGGYIPHHARLARIGAKGPAALLAEDGVRWIGPFHPAYKLSRTLGDAPAVDGHTAGVWRLRAALAPGADPTTIAAAAHGLGFDVLDAGEGRLILETAEGQSIAALARLDDVHFIEELIPARPLNDDTRGICQGGAPGAETIHARGLRGQGEVIAVMDTGLDDLHCCFNEPDNVLDVKVYGGGEIADTVCKAHGTQVAATAVCSNGGDHDGLAPDAEVVFQWVGYENFICLMVTPDPLAPAWDDARAWGARISNNSWGSGSGSYNSVAREVDDYMWTHQDFLVVFAGGNHGPGDGSLLSEANTKSGLSVGGTLNGAGREEVWDEASRGPAADGRWIKPDLAAPASEVWSAWWDEPWDAPSCGWGAGNGTSHAAPAAAGTAALVREYFGDGYYPSGAASATDGFLPSAALVKAMLVVSARNMTGMGTGGDRPNAHQGFGRLTLDDALWFDDEGAAERLVLLDDRDTATGFTEAGQTDSYQVTLDQAGSLRVMLVWTDYPGTQGTAVTLVNDLDLEVEPAGGSLYRGNQGFSGGWTAAPSTQGDRLHTKEAVYLQSVPAGDVTIRVRAHALGDVTAHPQDYALVLLGPVTPCSASAPEGVGDTVNHDTEGTDLVASWTERAADHYRVYRGTEPGFMNAAPAPYRDAVTDEDPGTPGVQWRDTGVLADGQTYYYVYVSVNGCGDEAP